MAGCSVRETSWCATLAVAMLGLVAGCSQLDPVKRIDLCDGDGVISANCPRCAAPPYPRQCSQCQGTDADPGCESPQAVTSSGSGAAGMTPAAGNSASTAGVGRDSGGAGAGGSRAGSGAPAIGGNTAVGGASMPAAGGGEPSACNPGCENPYPACWVKEERCVECVSDSDCMNKTCDIGRHVCVECVTDGQCPGRTCDTTTNTCVDCTSSTQCTTDPVLNSCNSAHKCVDCVGTEGCSDADNPVCVNETCVACDDDIHCRDPDQHKCLRQNHTCVECLTRADCPAERPACDEKTHVCVECFADTDCASGKHCLVPENRCVDCVDGWDCDDFNLGYCGPDYTCIPCVSGDNCAHFGAAKACDVETGACVQCLDDSTCGENACIRTKHVCSTVKQGSLPACSLCDADSQCGANLKCVNLSFGGQASDTYCLYTRSLLSCAASVTSATRPYTRNLPATSVDGEVGSYCAPQTTCEALRDASTPVGGKTCSGPAACGLGVDDAVCNSASRCTYVCTADVDCPREGLRVCSGTGAQKFCAPAE